MKGRYVCVRGCIYVVVMLTYSGLSMAFGN